MTSLRLNLGQVYDVASLELVGWTGAADGYLVDHYFGPRGEYLGPDQHGVEPLFSGSNTETTFNDFWNGNEISELFLVGFGCPAGQTLIDTTEDDTVVDEDYCDLADCLRTGLIRTEHDGEDSCFTGYGELVGEVGEDGKSWTWNSEGRAWDASGNDYYQIRLFARQEQA